MRVLGIETSCDETGLGLYDTEVGLLGHSLFSQVDLHKQYGGVVPELASRDHVLRILPLVDELLEKTGLTKADLDAVAYTAGPGLIGALLVGTAVGRSFGLWPGNPRACCTPYGSPSAGSFTRRRCYRAPVCGFAGLRWAYPTHGSQGIGGL